jgi:hypothetical protein
LRRACSIVGSLILAASTTGCGGIAARREAREARREPTLEETATEAFVYAFPMVQNYATLYRSSVAKGTPHYQAPINVLANLARVFSPDDTTVAAPNTDTSYSLLWMDLRAEPLVLSVPTIERERYYSIQLVDVYTSNFAYIGSRATGNDAGNYLIAGPDWSGETPPEISGVIRSDTSLALAIYRTQLFDATDLENVKAIESRYGVRTLSEFAGTETPPQAPELDFPAYDPDLAAGVGYVRYLNFMLRFCPTLDDEVELLERFAALGIGPGAEFAPDELEATVRAALEAGIVAGNEQIDRALKQTRSSAYLFGTRETLGPRYRIKRAVAARLGLYGNTKSEALYPSYRTDASGRPLDGSHRYELRFEAGGLPPVEAFWSLTMYDGESEHLVRNPLDRYLIGSAMADELVRDASGAITLYVQSDSPGPDREANWLPAPEGSFYLLMRLYWPQPAALQGLWSEPPLKRLD